MRALNKIVLSLAVVAAAAGAALAADGESAPATPKRKWREVPMPPLRQFTAPKPEVVTLGNGLKVFLMEDHELPLIDLVTLVRTGSVHEPREKAGLAEICGEVMRTGGTEKATGDEIDLELETIAASVEVGIGATEGRASLSCLKENFDQVLPILMDVIERPAFRQEKLDLSKKQAKSGIARRNDDPSGIARREYARVMYGDDSPYGWTEELATIDSITRDDLIAFHRRFFGKPSTTIVGVVGDFDPKAMKAKIEGTFGKWAADPKGEAITPPAVQGDGAPPKVYFARKTDVNQATIVMGHLGMKRTADDPDYAATIVANDILGGGGFAARLLQRVRTEMGLAYGVYSSWNAPYSHKGTFSLSCQTKSESTLQAIEAIKKELARMIAEPVTADELRVAKESIQQQLIFESDSKADVLGRALRYEYYGFPQDYLERFQAAIAKVTAEDVARVAKARFHPEKLCTVVVGNDAEFDGKLASLGEVVELDIETPAFPKGGKTAEAASPEAIAEGKAVIAKALESKGGRAALEAVKNVRTKGAGLVTTPQGQLPIEVDQLIVFPDRARTEMKLPVGVIVRAYDGKGGWLKAPMGVADLPPSEAKDFKEQIEKDEIVLLLALSKPDAQPAHAGTVEDEEAGTLDRIAIGDGSMLLVDKDGKLVGREEKSDKGTRITRWSDFRPVGGVQMPHQVRMLVDGEEAFRLSATSVGTNVEVAPDAFTKPAGDAFQPGGPARRPARQPQGEKQGAGQGN